MVQSDTYPHSDYQEKNKAHAQNNKKTIANINLCALLYSIE